MKRIKKRLPKKGQEVLTYYNDDGLHMYVLAYYYEKGDVIDTRVCKEYGSYSENLLHTLFDKKYEIVAEESGFYFYEDGWRKHNDKLTHWGKLPKPFKWRFWREDDEDI